MKALLRGLLACLLLVALSPGLGEARAQTKESVLHLGHVTEGWTDTPDKQGLLPVAREEAEIALEHAGYALAKGNSAAVVKEHVGHVLHALDPEAIEFGPGAGYGLIRAMTGVRDHLGYAAQSPDASRRLRKRTPKLLNRADWVIQHAKVMQELCKDAEQVENLEEALIIAEEIRNLARQVLGKKGIKGLEASIDRLAKREMATPRKSGSKNKAAKKSNTGKKSKKKTGATKKKKPSVYNAYGGSGGDR